MDEDHPDFCFGAQAVEIEELPICSGAEADALTAISKGILEEHGEEDPKKGWCQDTTLLHSIADREGV